MPHCRVCLKKDDNIPVGGTCNCCSTPPEWNYMAQRFRDTTPKPPKQVMCQVCGKDTGYNEKTVKNACWGKTVTGGHLCWTCYSNDKNSYKSGVSSFMCCGRDW